MIKNYLKSGWRNIIRQKIFSAINILGLATGMAAFLMLFLYIRHETSFDRFHENGDRIYRIISSFGGDFNDVLPRILPGVAEVLESQSPLVEKTLRMKPEQLGVRYNGREFASETILMTDACFGDFFDFPEHTGNIRQALSSPAGIVLSWELAQKLFGDADPMGQVVEVENLSFDPDSRRLRRVFESVVVEAVLEPQPSQTHITLAALRSYDAFDQAYAAGFANDVFVYLKTHQVLNTEGLESLSGIVKEYSLSLFGEEFRDILSYKLQPLHEIHFGEGYSYDMGPRGNKELIYIFAAVAFFILFIAIINFINLVTARSEKRAVEAAIRKVSGAHRTHIIAQFLGEAVLVSLFALVFSLLLVEIFMPSFSALLAREISFLEEAGIKMMGLLVVLVIIVGVLAGAYPAVVFSSYQPLEILRGKGRGGRRNPLMRIVLVVVQFSISVILVVSVMVFNRQIQYMKNSDLGFEVKNIMIFSGLSERLVSSYESLRAELMQHPGVEQVTASHGYPGVGGSGMSLRRAEDDLGVDISVSEYRVQRGFYETYGFRLKQGRWFDFDSETDRANFVINEAAVRAMGLDNPIGQEVFLWQRRGQIIGVVEDFHVSSLVHDVGPVALSAYAPHFYFISVKLAAGMEEAAQAHIQKVFAAFDQNYNPGNFYLENHFRNMYREEENNNKILNYASALAIIIAMLGVLGLSSYIVMARNREMGLRKVLGASPFQITWVLFKDIIRWVLIANLIAWPLAWVVMERWLAGFPYRIDMSVLYLILAGGVSLLVALAAISQQTIKAARTNPIDALKSE